MRTKLSACINSFGIRYRNTIHNGSGTEEFEQALPRSHGHSVPRVPKDEEEM